MLATAPIADLRNPDEAIQLAERAASLTQHRDAGVLDVLAAAQAAGGHFDRAVASCDQALALNPAAPLAGAIRQRRALYGEHRAYVSR